MKSNLTPPKTVNLDKSHHLKVLHIASGDLWAGAEVQLFTLVKALHEKLDISVCVVLLNHGTLEQRLRVIGIQVIVLDESKLNGIQILRQLIRTIRKQNPDVIHTHRIKENILGSIAAFLSGRIPTIRTAHGAPEHKPSWRQLPKRLIVSLDWFCGRFLQQKIIAVSGDLSEILKKDYLPKKICIIKNGIDLESLSKFKRNTQSNTEPFKIGLAGRLVPIKRVDIFIKTAQYILNQYPELKISFHIYGDGPLRKQLEQLNHELKTDNIVHFEGHCSDMTKRLQELDILVMTSDHEGLPMILLEAMALEIPVIAHAVGGIPELLDHGTCGILVQNHSITGYAEEILRTIREPERRVITTENALNRIKANYSAEQNANAYCMKYAEIC